MSNGHHPAGEPQLEMDEDSFWDVWHGRLGNPMVTEEMHERAVTGRLPRLRTADGEVYDLEIGPDGTPRRASQL